MVGRRALLRVTALAPAATVLSAAAAGCSSPTPDKPDPLEPVTVAARQDTALAEAVAVAFPDLAADAKRIADARTKHANALQREIDRVQPPEPGNQSPTPKRPTPKRPTPSPRVPTTAEKATASLRRTLQEAQRQAASIVPDAPSYRAGLAGSVSASCASLREMLP